LICQQGWTFPLARPILLLFLARANRRNFVSTRRAMKPTFTLVLAVVVVLWDFARLTVVGFRAHAVVIIVLGRCFRERSSKPQVKEKRPRGHRRWVLQRIRVRVRLGLIKRFFRLFI
jgi:hypothetical protein